MAAEPATELHGHCDPAFTAVRRAFAANFADGDLGASCAVVHRGETVVDLWGGHRDVARTQPWERDTIVNVWSTTKMISALCVLVLHDRGELTLDDPVASHWPEFAAAGKEHVLVRHLLSHTAGLPGFDPPVETEDEMYDWDGCCARLAAAEPWWEPGTAAGYHASTQSWLLGELVRRVDGRTLGTFCREEVAGPLGADFHIGLADTELARVAEMRTDELEQPSDGTEFALRQQAGEPEHSQFVNTDRWRRAEFPASNGHGNARSVAAVVSVLGSRGRRNGVRLLEPATIERCFEVQAHGIDLVLGFEVEYGIGFGLNCPGTPIGVNDRTLFWAGWGGSMAVVDVENELTVAYVMNRMLPDVAGGLRAARVVFAAHDAVARRRGRAG
ncbi:MAG: serine hydrolase domain-containing protein [Acidimicrobiales bacterium]